MIYVMQFSPTFFDPTWRSLVTQEPHWAALPWLRLEDLTIEQSVAYPSAACATFFDPRPQKTTMQYILPKPRQVRHAKHIRDLGWVAIANVVTMDPGASQGTPRMPE